MLAVEFVGRVGGSGRRPEVGRNEGGLFRGHGLGINAEPRIEIGIHLLDATKAAHQALPPPPRAIPLTLDIDGHHGNTGKLIGRGHQLES